MTVNRDRHFNGESAMEKREVITPLCRCDNLDEPLKRRGNHLIGVADLCKAIRIHRNQRSRLVRLRRTDS